MDFFSWDELQTGINSAISIAMKSVEEGLITAVKHFPFVLIGLTILVATFFLAKLIDKVALSLIKRSGMRNSLQELMLRVISMIVWTIGITVAALVVFPGVTPAKILGGLGLLSVAVGFAFKDIFENFFAGALILWKYPFEHDDVVEVEGITGRITSTSTRSSTIETLDGKAIIVPNALLYKNPVEVHTARSYVRECLEVGVSYDTDLDEAASLIEDTVHNCTSVKRKELVEVIPHTFGGSSIDISIYWWTASGPKNVRRSRAEVLMAIKRAFDREGVDIPFPHRTLLMSDDTKGLIINQINGNSESSNEQALI